MEQLGSHWANFREIFYLNFSFRFFFFLKSVEKIQVPLKSDKNNGYFTWIPIYLLGHNSLSSSYNEKLFRKKKVSGKIKTRILCSTAYLFNRAVYEIMWKNTVQPDRPQMTIWRMRFARWVPNATNTLSVYVTLIACTLQQWLNELALILRYTYIACLLIT